jgi:uncharacterized cupin superfamily protein
MASRHEVLDSLNSDPLDPAQVIDGDPRTCDLTLTQSEDGSQVTGLWSCTPGTFSDTELEESFVVVEGEAEVRFRDGSAVNLKAGDTHRFEAGEQTVWQVTSPLVKCYWARTEPETTETDR